MKEFRECLGAHGFEAALPEKLHRLLAALLVRARYRLLHPIHLLLLPHLECIDFVFFCVWSPVIHPSAVFFRGARVSLAFSNCACALGATGISPT